MLLIPVLTFHSESGQVVSDKISWQIYIRKCHSQVESGEEFYIS